MQDHSPSANSLLRIVSLCKEAEAFQTRIRDAVSEVRWENWFGTAQRLTDGVSSVSNTYSSTRSGVETRKLEISSFFFPIEGVELRASSRVLNRLGNGLLSGYWKDQCITQRMVFLSAVSIGRGCSVLYCTVT